ncbi:hybrid sensor histidine kinase/response regulator [Brunnivagina elsteri]|uniref:histidine kinase n=1 Tax=Brunnivagina elsteri CCALA 953 TaxID=987040 RepID=A0A2A2TKK7_9CYAN|nr:hybrid sensor histidine kinase/response regulator [Calothrix elsteri]PAX56561.1 hybrid sensor histidine kinase/response regulator [Calothrix elsteri CCALA 953]
MTNKKELEIKSLFLEEANDHLNTIESVILEVRNNRKIDIQSINNAMRAAHSIKGGAAIMGFEMLSELSHRLEDYFNVLKTKKESLEINVELQSLLLSSLDCLRQILFYYVHENDSYQNISDNSFESLTNNIESIFNKLYEILGDANPEDANSILATEENAQDIIPLIFQTQVEEYLQRLENLLQENSQGLHEEVMTMANELGGLGHMLQIEAFTMVCESVASHLISTDNNSDTITIARLALDTWRNSQNLILTNQIQNLPSSIDLNNLTLNNLNLNNLNLNNLNINAELKSIENYLNSPIFNISNFLEESEDISNVNNDNLNDSRLNDSSYNTPLISTQQRNSNFALNEIAFDTEVEKAIVEKSIVEKTSASENTVRVPVKHLEKINNFSSELTTQRHSINNKLESLNTLIQNLNQTLRSLDLEYRHENRKTSKKAPQQALQSYLAKLHEVAADIRITLTETEQTQRQVNKTAQHLQHSLTQILMRPLADILERFPRALHDLSIEYNKQVELKVTGADTLIERSILDVLQEPLLHILRNAFDHGIEDSEIRIAAAKPKQGLIEITATHCQNRIIITVRDDGRGIGLEKIRQRGLEIGIDATLLAQASDEDILSLIFEPGFSTSKEVSALSGRGVGMDVVRNNLIKIQGEVTVDTKEGKGTAFILSVPFTLSVTRVLLIESQSMLFACPTSAIAEIFLLPDEQIFTIAGKEYLRHQKAILPLIRLSEYLHFNSRGSEFSYKYRCENSYTIKPPAIDAATVLLIKYENQDIAIQVERCWRENEVVIRQVEGNIPLPVGFSSCTIIGDGLVVPVVNLFELLRSSNKLQMNSLPKLESQLEPKLNNLITKQTQIIKEEEELGKRNTNTTNILLIDDSINVRRYLAYTLEKVGYRVEQASDGLNGLAKLQAGLSVQTIICDIDMPRLDGFGFLARIKAQKELKHIPVIILTSKTSERYRQLAIQLGAKAYLNKPYNEYELLKVLSVE